MTIAMRGNPAGGENQQDSNNPAPPQQQQQQQVPAQPAVTQPPTTNVTTTSTSQPVTTQPQSADNVSGTQPLSPPGGTAQMEQTTEPSAVSTEPVPMEEGGQGDGGDAVTQVPAVELCLTKLPVQELCFTESHRVLLSCIFLISACVAH
jgi:hypothetical protein